MGRASLLTSTELQVPPSTLPPHHTGSSISWYTVSHSAPLSTCVPCMRLAWFRHEIYLRNGTYMYCPTVPQSLYLCVAILAIHSPISQSGGQVIVNGLDSISTSTVSYSKETSKTVCQTKQFIICQSCRKAAGSNDISTLYWYHIQSRVKIESNSHYQQCRLVLRTFNPTMCLTTCTGAYNYT